MAVLHLVVAAFWIPGRLAYYEWGHDNTYQPESLTEYHNTVLIPDPDLPAPSAGTLASLRLYSQTHEAVLRLAVLQVHHIQDDETYYRCTGLSGDIQLANESATHDLTSSGLTVSDGDVMAFVVTSSVTLSHVTSSECDESRMYQLRQGTSLQVGEVYGFLRNTEGSCLDFTYMFEVIESGTTTTTTTTTTDAVDVLESDPRDHIHHTGLAEDERTSGNRHSNAKPGPGEEDLCEQSLCEDDETIRTLDHDDLFRYIIFGPLVILWIIVSVLCTIKLKRRCCVKNAIAVTPTGRLQSANRTSAHAPAGNPGRPRFARIILSHTPPEPRIAQKPVLAVLPPYSGTHDTNPIPSYAPPAYSATKDANADPKPTDTAQVTHINRAYNSDDLGDAGGQITTADPRTASSGVPWSSHYVSNPMYFEPPPPYEQSPQSGHM